MVENYANTTRRLWYKGFVDLSCCYDKNDLYKIYLLRIWVSFVKNIWFVLIMPISSYINYNVKREITANIKNVTPLFIGFIVSTPPQHL